MQRNPKFNPTQLHARNEWDELLKKLGHYRPEIEREVTAFFNEIWSELTEKSDSKNDIFIRYDMTTATNMMSKKNYLSRPLMLKYPNLSLNMIKAERDIFENDVVTAPFEY